MHIPFFHQNNSPLEQTKVDQDPSVVPTVKPNHTKKIIIISAVVVFLILNIVLLFATGIIPSPNLPFVQKPTPTPKPDVLLATVGDKRIYQSSVDMAMQKEWGAYTSQYRKNKKLQEKALANLIEESIIQQEAKKMGISVSSAEIDQKEQEQIKQAGGINNYNKILKNNGWTMQDQKDKIRNTLLKEKVVDKVIAWRLVNYVGSSQNVAAPNYASKTAEATANITKARQYLREGKSAKEAASLVTNNFTTSFNIYYGENVKLTRLSKIDEKFINGIFQLHTGETSNVIGAGTPAMMTARILEENDTQFNSYEEWLNTMKKLYKI